MKRLHRDDLFGWSVFDESRNIDFHGLAWVRGGGNVLVDPMPMSAHDEGAPACTRRPPRRFVVTNSDHTRDAVGLAQRFGAKMLGPRGERDGFPIQCDGWLGQGGLGRSRPRRPRGGRLEDSGGARAGPGGDDLDHRRPDSCPRGRPSLPSARREAHRFGRGTFVGAAPRGPARHRGGAGRRRLAGVPPRGGSAARTRRFVRRHLKERFRAPRCTRLERKFRTCGDGGPCPLADHPASRCRDGPEWREASVELAPAKRVRTLESTFVGTNGGERVERRQRLHARSRRLPGSGDSALTMAKRGRYKRCLPREERLESRLRASDRTAPRLRS